MKNSKFVKVKFNQDYETIKAFAANHKMNLL